MVDMRKLALLSLIRFLSTNLFVCVDSADVGPRPDDVRNGEPHGRVLSNLPWKIVGELPHDKSSFTQGLTYHNGILFEGTGLRGESRLRRINPTDGSVMKSSPYMSSKYFGEGIAHYNDKNGDDRIIQLTWRKKMGFIYTPGLTKLSSFSFQTTTGEGWGITNDGNGNFIVSDGSQYLHFWDDRYLTQNRRVAVTHNGKSISNLNELEYVSGRILANVWYSDNIYVIDPTDGNVLQVYNFSSLYRSGDVLNGISVTGVRGELFITGKKWPVIYRIRLLDFWVTERKLCVQKAVKAHDRRIKRIKINMIKKIWACGNVVNRTKKLQVRRRKQLANCTKKLQVKLRRDLASSQKQKTASVKACKLD